MNRAPRYEAELSPRDASAARRLIPSEFFGQASTDSKRRRPDAFVHEIAVEDEGREHRVMLADEEISPALRPFVDWLQRRAGVT